ncbi:hypothetical protein [Dietzia lutea]|uniref:Uncharacterized protein n=1 Tax=Dietzia lutea TaxID=546160 RepID=A0A2S1RAR1_9ACTN|nr:hypothetical protein [Dietzia lutea]AWH93380.1 hypothetical protein A6035_15660 [Dietzia lutea]
MLPLRRRILPLLCVFLGAPVAAEYLQAYLPFTGELWASLFGIVFFAPLYGGAALLIREVGVRYGMGWRGTLLLAAAFGLAMTGIIDMSMFGEERPDVPYWAELREPTLIEPLGVSIAATLSWTLGHVMMSVGAPLALLYALAPAHRGRPLLGKKGIPLTLFCAAVIALAVHQDGQQTYGYSLSPARVAVVLAVVVLLVGAAFVARHRPTRAPSNADDGGPGTQAEGFPRAGHPLPVAALVASGLVGKVLVDLAPSTWPGVAATVVLVAFAGLALSRASVRRPWGPREVGSVGVGLVIGAVLIGFAAPVPGGVPVAAKIAQSSVLLILALALLWLVIRRTGPGYRSSAAGSGASTGRGATVSSEGRNRPAANSRP